MTVNKSLKSIKVAPLFITSGSERALLVDITSPYHWFNEASTMQIFFDVTAALIFAEIFITLNLGFAECM